MKYSELFSMDVYDFLEWLDKNFKTSDISIIETKDDLDHASKELIRLTGLYSYITQLLSWAKAYTRQLKRIGDTTLYEDMVDRRDAIENKMNAVAQSYKGISRAVTIKLEVNQELRMTGIKYAS